MKTEEKDKNIMKKVLLLLAMVCLPLFASAQTTEKQYYIYNIVTFSGSLKNAGFKVDLDDGKTIEKLKDSKGKNFRKELLPVLFAPTSRLTFFKGMSPVSVKHL